MLSVYSDQIIQLLCLNSGEHFPTTYAQIHGETPLNSMSGLLHSGSTFLGDIIYFTRKLTQTVTIPLPGGDRGI